MADVSPEEWRERWHSYINDLDRLRLGVSKADRIHDFDEATETLHEIVDEVADVKEAEA